MKIVFIADAIDNQSAGIHVYIKNLIDNLLEIDKKNEYIFIHNKKNPYFTKKTHFIIPSSKFPWTEAYRRIFLLPKLLKKLKPDIVVEPCHLGPFFTPKNSKRVTVIYDLSPIFLPNFHRNTSVLLHKLLQRKSLKKADLVLTISNNSKKDILKYEPKTRNIVVTYAGLKKQDLKKIKSKTKTLIRKPYLLHLGTIEPRKNIGILVDALLELKNELNLPHKLVLAGSIGWKSKKLLSKIKKYKDIIITGKITEEEKSNLLSNTEIFIYPSFYEGFGLPPLEAMSQGIPVICSNGGSLGELYSKYALTFDPSDKNALKLHIKKLLSNKHLQEKHSIEGKKYAKKFTWRKSARIALDAFEKLTTNRN